MALIKKGMSINCRNREEVEVFQQVATAEGHKWCTGDSLLTCYANEQSMSYQVGCFATNPFPNDITFCHDFNYTHDGKLTLVEASDVFGNYLISRRAKRERSICPK